MVLSKNNVTIIIEIDKDVKPSLLKHSQELDLTISKFTRNLLYHALNEFKLYRSTGITTIVAAFRNAIDSIPSNKRKIDAKIAELEKRRVTVSIVIDADVKQTIEKLAAEIGLPFKTFTRNLLYVALDDFKLVKKAGVVRVAVLFRGLLDKFTSAEFVSLAYK